MQEGKEKIEETIEFEKKPLSWFAKHLSIKAWVSLVSFIFGAVVFGWGAHIVYLEHRPASKVEEKSSQNPLKSDIAPAQVPVAAPSAPVPKPQQAKNKSSQPSKTPITPSDDEKNVSNKTDAQKVLIISIEKEMEELIKAHNYRLIQIHEAQYKEEQAHASRWGSNSGGERERAEKCRKRLEEENRDYEKRMEALRTKLKEIQSGWGTSTM